VCDGECTVKIGKTGCAREH